MTDDEQSLRDFYQTWSRGLNNALHDAKILLSGQDAYEIVVCAFGRAPSIEEFSTLTEADFLKLRDAARSVLENTAFEEWHMRSAFENAMRFWHGASH